MKTKMTSLSGILSFYASSRFTLRGLILGLLLLFSSTTMNAQVTDLASWTATQIASGALSWVGGEAMTEVFGSSPVSLSEESIAAIGAELESVLDEAYLSEIHTLFNTFFKTYEGYDHTDFEPGSEAANLQMNRLSDLLTQGFSLTQRLEDLMLLDDCRTSGSAECPTAYATTEPTVLATYLMAQTMFIQVLIEQDNKAHSDITQSYISTESLRSYNYINEFVIDVQNLRYPYPYVLASDAKTVLFSCCLLPGGNFDACTKGTYRDFHDWFGFSVCADEYRVTYPTAKEASDKVNEVGPQIAQNRLDLVLGEGFEEVLEAWNEISENYAAKSMFPVARK